MSGNKATVTYRVQDLYACVKDFCEEGGRKTIGLIITISTTIGGETVAFILKNASMRIGASCHGKELWMPKMTTMTMRDLA